MKTIHRNKIRNIVACLVNGCEVEIVTPRKTKSRPFQKPQQLISFGTGERGNDILFEHCIDNGGTILSINTLYYENGNILDHFSYHFKIILPEGCHLKFTYTPDPLGWGPKD